MAGEHHHGMGAAAEGEWYIELDQGWTPWMVEGLPCQGISDAPFRYSYGKTEFEAQFQSETEGIQTNLSTGKQRVLRKQTTSPSEGSDSRRMHQQPVVNKRPGILTGQVSSSAEKPPAAKVETLPTCYFLASSATQYDGDFEWLIELEKGWTPWLPENQPFQGRTDQPLRYTLGRYGFEVNFASESHGTQTNLATGKVRRIQRRHKAEPMPAWEGTGIRRRPVSGGTADLPAAPPSSEARIAQARRAERRASGGYPGGGAQSALGRERGPDQKQTSEMQRPRVSQSAQSESQPCRSGSRLERNSATVPHYMRGLKSKTQA